MKNCFKADNRGLTLIELIVCSVIFAIVAAAVYGFMLTGSYSFNSVDKDVNLQVNSDVAMNHISQYMMNCATGVVFASNTLYLISRDSVTAADGSATYTADIFQLKSDGCIYYASTPAALQSDGTYSCSFTATDLLVKNVSSFSVSFSPSDDGTEAVGAKLTVQYKYDEKYLSAERTVALRNDPALAALS